MFQNKGDVRLSTNRERRTKKIEIEHFMYSAFHDQTKSRNMKFQDFV